MVKPRSGSLPRQASLMALSWLDQLGARVRLAHQREPVVARHPVEAWRIFFMPVRVRLKVWQRMIASSPR